MNSIWSATSLLLMMTCLVSLCESESAGGRYPIISRSCLDKSESEWTLPRPAFSIRHCLIVSRFEKPTAGVGVVQLDKRDSTCSVFLFSRVCHLLNLSSPASSEHQSDCELVVDSELDAVVTNQHFAAVWIGGRGPQLENLVCGPEGQKNRIEHSGVEWTSEGARMDGVSSRLWLNRSEGLDFKSSLTWLIELKREPGANALIEMTHCNSFDGPLFHLWEWGYGTPVYTCRLYYNGLGNLNSKQMILPQRSDQFTLVGVATENSTTVNRTRLFFDRDYLPFNEVNIFDQTVQLTLPYCIKFGWRYAPTKDGLLNGTIRMIAMANNFLPVDVIRRLAPTRSP